MGKKGKENTRSPKVTHTCTQLLYASISSPVKENNNLSFNVIVMIELNNVFTALSKYHKVSNDS